MSHVPERLCHSFMAHDSYYVFNGQNLNIEIRGTDNRTNDITSMAHDSYIISLTSDQT